jgi:HEAT repeat protein
MAGYVNTKSLRRTMFRILLSCGLLAGIAHGQADHAQQATRPVASKSKVAVAVARVRAGNFNGYDVELIREAGAIEAIPDLEKQFARASEPLDKAKIAVALLALGDKKDVHWNFLVQLVKPVLESDAPNPVQNDPLGKAMPGLSLEFIAWTKSHNQSPDEAGEDAIYVFPGEMLLLGGTRDPRAIPLLRQALSSPNEMIEIAAARGLAEIQDASSVPLIVDLCKKAPAETASLIAESLVYFDDPQAQSAVDAYVPKEKAKALRETRKKGEGALHR